MQKAPPPQTRVRQGDGDAFILTEGSRRLSNTDPYSATTTSDRFRFRSCSRAPTLPASSLWTNCAAIRIRSQATIDLEKLVLLRAMDSKSLLKYPSPMCGSFCEPHGQTEFRDLRFRSASAGQGAEGWVGGFIRSAPAVSGYESG